VESWNPDWKAFKIVRMEVPFSVYEVSLLTGLPATGKHVMFEWGQDPCKVEEVVEVAIDDHLTREMTRHWTGQTGMRMYRNYMSVILNLCK